MTTDAMEIGSRDLRPQLADRINAAVQGEITYITNHRRRVAAIVPLAIADAGEPEDYTAGAVVTGHLKPVDPIDFDEVLDAGFRHAHQESPNHVAQFRRGDMALDIYVDSVRGIDDEWEKAGVRVVPQIDAPADVVALMRQTRALIRLFPDTDWNGHLEITTQNPLQRVRLVVSEGDVKVISPTITWGDTPATIDDALNQLADQIEALPQDYELDPGRGDVVKLINQRTGRTPSF